MTCATNKKPNAHFLGVSKGENRMCHRNTKISHISKKCKFSDPRISENHKKKENIKDN
jgi:hypothetical protein